MAKIIYSFAALAGLIIFANCQDTCRLDSCHGRPHTLCKYSSPKPAAQCNKVNTATITEDEKKEIVATHNRLRAQVASGGEKRGKPGPQPAGKIGKLVWDSELANIAQRWANQCVFGHDQCRNVARFSVGQNVGYKAWSDGFHVKYSEIIQAWYDEVKDFDRNRVSNFQSIRGPVVGHYTQLVWGATTKIGCGGVRFKSADGWYKTQLVCNYGPAGNMIGAPVYKKV